VTHAIGNSEAISQLLPELLDLAVLQGAPVRLLEIVMVFGLIQVRAEIRESRQVRLLDELLDLRQEHSKGMGGDTAEADTQALNPSVSFRVRIHRYHHYCPES